MAASAVTAVPNKEKPKPAPVDREKTCPFLLRVFCNTGRPYMLSEFTRGNTPPNELQIYTWYDATLKELANLVKEVNPDARVKGTFIDFNIVCPNLQQGRYITKEMGSICVGRKGLDDMETLKSKRFIIGDYLNIAICPPRSPMMRNPRGPMRMRPY